jgi:hypothetical protein
MQTTSGFMIVLVRQMYHWPMEVYGCVAMMELLGKGHEGFRAKGAWRSRETNGREQHTSAKPMMTVL